VGEIHDFVFDDRFWRIRCVLVNTGGWLGGRTVLLSPEVFRKRISRISNGRTVFVRLTRNQVRRSPLVETDRPQGLIDLPNHYGWSLNNNGGLWPGIMQVPMGDAEYVVPAEIRNDAHLRTIREMEGTDALAIDGEIGGVDDVIADLGHPWTIRYLVVGTKKWLGGRKVLIDPHWLSLPISWPERRLEVIAMRESIRNSPELDPAKPITRRYEAQMFEHYGRPKYWERKE
jgi:hypothetical protein